MKSYKICYIGNFRPENSTECHLAKDMENVGIVVTRMQEQDVQLEELLEHESEYDFILYTRTWDNVKGDREYFLKNHKTPFVGFSLDIWYGLVREEQIRTQLFFKVDYLITADGGHQEEFKRDGIKHKWLPPAIFSEQCYVAEPKDEYKFEVLFVGSRDYHKEYPERPMLINWLFETYGDRFKLITGGLRGRELNEVYSSAKVIVGDSLEGEYYWSDRIPETVGRGGFLLHPETVGLYFPVVTYKRGDGYEDLKKKIDFYLEEKSERDRIRFEGQEWVAKNRTYKNVAKEIISYLEEQGAI